MEPLNGSLDSVYSLYNLDEDGVRHKRRDSANPKYTNYSPDFQGTMDHILYSKNSLEVLELL